MDAFFNIGNFYFDLITIIIFALVLIAMIIGACRGFLRQIVGFLKVIGTIVAAIFLCKWVGDLIYNLGVGEGIYNSVYTSDWIQGKPGLEMTLDSTNFPSYEVESMKTMILNEVDIPSFLHGMFKGFLDLPETLPASGGIALGVYVATAIAHLTTTGIAFVAIIIVCSIVCALLGLIAKKVHRAPGIGGVDKLFGLILGVVICYLIIDATLFGVSVLVGINPSLPINDWITKTLYLDPAYDNVFTVSKFIYQNSIIAKIWTAVFGG